MKLLLSLLLFIAMEVRADGFGEPTMSNLTLSDGLAGETVRRVMTDHNGYIWIATTGGVSVFNGRDIMSHRILNQKGRSLEVLDLCETSDLSVYAATEDGLYRLSTTSGVFEHIFHEIKHPQTLLAVGDTVYIGGEQGLQIYDGKQLKQQDVGISHKGLDNIVRHYVQDDEGYILFSSRHDLNRYNPKTEHVDHYNLTGPLRGKFVLSQFDIAKGKFFIGTRTNGLYIYDQKTHQARHLDAVGQIVMSVQRSHDGLIAVATDGSGAYLIDPEKEQVVESFSINASGMHQLPTNAIYSFYRDHHGINWLGTVRSGLVYNPYNSFLFHPFEAEGLTTKGMNVRNFLLQGNEILLGLQDGLWVVDTMRHAKRFFTPEELGGHIVNNIQWWQGHYIIGMFDGGVRLLDSQTLSLSHQTWSPLLKKANVGDIKVAPDSTLWIGCNDGLFIISTDGSVRQLTEQNSHIIGGNIINITFDSEGNAWLSGAKGLSLYSVSSQDIVEASFPEGFFNEESYMRGILGHNGIVYLRNGPQVFYTANKMKDFGELRLPVRLTDRWCRGMVDNMNGDLWLASERGLLGTSYQGETVIQIGEGEGLLGSQISELKMGEDRILWVATSSGLYSASQKDLSHWMENQIFPVTLYNVQKDNDIISKTDMSLLSERHELSLSWNFTSQVLKAEPLLLDYAPQKGRIYEYRIDSQDWLLIENDDPIDVRNLMIGRHELTVRMAGVKGTETVYHLKVLPSIAAYIELLLLVTALLLLWLWWRYRKNTKILLSERDEIEDALVESEALREETELGEPAQKYQKVKVDEAECAEIVKRMKTYLERERVYTNADLKMKDLADVLHLSAPKLSQVFNLYLNENYYEFINRYRLNEFKRLIEIGEYKRYTITALSEQCGFKKSNFFSTFRKVEGMTPAEYLKKLGIQS